MDADGAPKKQRTLGEAVQWIVFVLLALFALAVATDIRKLGAPGAPVTLYFITLAVVVGVALLHLPAIFFRLPRKARWAAYGSIILAFVLFGNTLSVLGAAYDRTPEGAKEAAELAAKEKAAQAAQAEKDAAAKAERDRAAADAAVAREASFEQQRKELCDSLQANVIAMSKAKLAFNVIEINDIQVGYGSDANNLKCTGSAVTTNGDRSITFGIETTPQGKELLTYKLD